VIPPDALAPLSERGYVPRPEIVTVMLIGGQPALSSYAALNRMGVAVVPVPGDAVPSVRVMSCDAPLQLAA
jgi:hypothetical protein